MATLLSDKIDLGAKKITREKEVHYITVKWSIYQEDIKILSMCVPKTEPQNMWIKTDKAERRNFFKNPQLQMETSTSPSQQLKELLDRKATGM